MKGLTEESIAQIDDPEKLRYLLSGVVQKNTKQLKRIRVLQRQLKNSKNEISELNSALIESKNKCEKNSFYKFEYDFEKIRADYNEFAFTSLFEIIQNLEIEQLDKFLHEAKQYENLIKSKQKDQIDEMKQIINERDKKIHEKEQKILELQEKIEKIESSPISKDVEDLLSEKDQSIVKLRALIQRYAKSDQIKQQQIDEQQRQIQQMMDKYSNYSNNYSSNLSSHNSSSKSSNVKEILVLERKVADLELQLKQCGNVHEIESKNEKLNAMLDKSNKLYTQLSEKYQILLDSIKKDKKLTINQNLLFEIHSIKNSSNSCSNSKSRDQNHKKSKHEKNHSLYNETETTIMSLRKTLLQFFLTEEENQENLIPVILEIVGCNQDQIRGAIRNHQSHKTLINRAGSLFGLFS
ncbi:hypothetical protein TRFO_31349 [Tritrichomonas foetus]|uniref:GRIP domain-containing protein n=1 Tax=Tritrichomonas foetus TaxID=1144522 RepID=A0A1J4JTI5_9EUKA|nr:hypothetical protein TRFO_31349 [Tritrichomonas foetus]|eukprot:OHT01736.1 hypothetical protein TRFO_31349 [Tritrichomonas foetus]